MAWWVCISHVHIFSVGCFFNYFRIMTKNLLRRLILIYISHHHHLPSCRFHYSNVLLINPLCLLGRLPCKNWSKNMFWLCIGFLQEFFSCRWHTPFLIHGERFHHVSWEHYVLLTLTNINTVHTLSNKYITLLQCLHPVYWYHSGIEWPAQLVLIRNIYNTMIFIKKLLCVSIVTSYHQLVHTKKKLCYCVIMEHLIDMDPLQQGL